MFNFTICKEGLVSYSIRVQSIADMYVDPYTLVRTLEGTYEGDGWISLDANKDLDEVKRIVHNYGYHMSGLRNEFGYVYHEVDVPDIKSYEDMEVFIRTLNIEYCKKSIWISIWESIKRRENTFAAGYYTGDSITMFCKRLNTLTHELVHHYQWKYHRGTSIEDADLIMDMLGLSKPDLEEIKRRWGNSYCPQEYLAVGLQDQPNVVVGLLMGLSISQAKTLVK